MDIQQSVEQVAGILHRAELEFDTHPDGDGYRLCFESAGVFIAFAPWRDGVRVVLTSPIVSDIEPGTAGEAAALNELNRLNQEHGFLKFFYDEGTLVGAYDLLGDTLRAQDLLNGVFALAATAERLGEELAGELGGVTFELVD